MASKKNFKMQFLGLKKKYQIFGLNLYFLFTFQPSTIKTPPLRPFVRPPSPPPPPPIRPSPPPISTELPEPEVLFAGQAFDIDPSRPPPAGRPEIFDLTVSVKQNFGGKQSQNKGKTIFYVTFETLGYTMYKNRIKNDRTNFILHFPLFYLAKKEKSQMGETQFSELGCQIPFVH